ncbi:sulfotransferase family protein [Bacillus sp. JCM 19034]|uniref:sulfotransferase family protein n=1 Tax=Bacillus sp. JCM 19034 TaxID=1481928 RepID=UPI00078598F7|nr:sulfotransferase family protein [Bacillus sp. JCM 19034]
MRIDGRKPKVVCILGMHRSGTSMTARMLNLLGVHLGNPIEIISKGGQFNQKGFWEHKGITRTQQQLLRALSYSWDTTRPLPERWWKSKKIEPHRKSLEAIIKRDFSKVKLWGWKDPRTCLLVPLWNELLLDKHVNSNYLIVVRNPLDVARSLEARNSFSLEKSFQIWLLYTLSALYWTNGKKRMLIEYDDFLQNWEERISDIVTKLQLQPPNQSVREKMSTFISPSLQHNCSTIEELKDCEKAPQQVIQTYQLVQKVRIAPTFLSSEECRKEIQVLYQSQFGKRR